MAIARRPISLTFKNAGDAINHDEWNAVIRELQRLGNIACAGNITISNIPNGILITVGKDAAAAKVNISGAIGGQAGRYDAKQYIEKPNPAASGALVDTDIGSLPADDDTIVWNLDEINGGSALNSGDVKTGVVFGTDTASGKTIVLVSGGGGGGGMFPIKVSKVGGTQGDLTTAATWTYDVKDLDGNVLGTAIELAHRRPLGTASFPSPDSYGEAFYDNNDADHPLKLWDANEIYGTGDCP